MDGKRVRKISLYLEKEVDDCGKCPLENICDEAECHSVWIKFFDSKVRQKDMFEN